MSKEDDIVKVVDELVDAIDPDNVEHDADRLGITVEELMHRVNREVLSRLTDLSAS